MVSLLLSTSSRSSPLPPRRPAIFSLSWRSSRLKFSSTSRKSASSSRAVADSAADTGRGRHWRRAGLYLTSLDAADLVVEFQPSAEQV